MNIHIREEQAGDRLFIFNLIEKAFADVAESDHQEQFLVERLHQSKTFVPSLSLVAETENWQIVGYILLTEVEIVSNNSIDLALGVAPLAVLPEYQRMGIGGMLLHEAWKSHSTLTLLATQDLPTFLFYMIDPLKSWCWGSILFYPFKNSRFS